MEFVRVLLRYVLRTAIDLQQDVYAEALRQSQLEREHFVSNVLSSTKQLVDLYRRSMYVK